MTPEQAAEFNRIAIKTEALQDSFADQGFKGLVISGMMDPTYIWTTDARRQLRLPERLHRQRWRPVLSRRLFGYDNSYFGQAMLDIQKETEDGTRWRLTLAPQKNASSGYNLRLDRARGQRVAGADRQPDPAVGRARSPTGRATSTSGATSSR